MRRNIDYDGMRCVEYQTTIRMAWRRPSTFLTPREKHVQIFDWISLELRIHRQLLAYLPARTEIAPPEPTEL